ncbi:DUF1002 domain-containing protein [Chryseomicrobium sp. FSL W7-1435]|uniref:DUF1002 domain-containing protein n=1 Tax=Chryseomicrobium sp. FSL W7-1435 TaxID=2921704 RepID=UPI00315A52B7
MKKWLVSLLALVLLFPTVTFANGENQEVIDEKLGVPIVVYGANLTAEQKVSVQNALQVSQDSTVEEITVTGEDLATYITDGNPSARMFSSAKITRTDAGEGLVISIVTPENITQVTNEMYANAMLTAGIENATVEVAAPSPVTGHSALVGIYKAYEATGGQLDSERTDVANEELSVATILSEESGVDPEKVSELLTEIKQQIAEQNPATREDVEQIVSDQLANLQIELSEQDRQLLIDLMDRIRQLDIDFSQWSTQLEDLSNSIQEQLGTIVENEGFWNGVRKFFNDLISSIRSIFN